MKQKLKQVPLFEDDAPPPEVPPLEGDPYWYARNLSPMLFRGFTFSGQPYTRAQIDAQLVKVLRYFSRFDFRATVPAHPSTALLAEFEALFRQQHEAISRQLNSARDIAGVSDRAAIAAVRALVAAGRL